MKTLLTTLALALTLIASPINAIEFPAIDTITASTHHLVASEKGRALYRCTAEFISPEYLVSAAHCVHPEVKTYTIDLNGTMVYVSPVGTNAANDVAIFKLTEGINNTFVKLPETWFGDPMTPVLVVCYNGENPKLSVSVPFYISELDNIKIDEIAAKVQGAVVMGGDIHPGCSGGGVYANLNGEWMLIGTTVGITIPSPKQNDGSQTASFISRYSSLKDITQFVLR